MPQSFCIQSQDDLSCFVLDLCGFSLDKAGFRPESYGFYLHVAFRRQMVLQRETWNTFCQEVQDKPYQKEDLDKLQPFVSSILADVEQSKDDILAVKLLKTSYLSTLDKLRQNTERALILYKTPIFVFNEAGDSSEELEQDLIDNLQVQIEFLDKLLALPFLLEKLCQTLAANRKINYEPGRCTSMLAALLEICGQISGQEQMFSALHVILQISLPDLPLDHDVLHLLHEELLPVVKELNAQRLTLYDFNQRFLPEDDPCLSKARKQLLAAMGVELHSLQSIVNQTLIEPVTAYAQLTAELSGIVHQGRQILNNANPLDKIIAVSRLFSHLDACFQIPAELPCYLMPAWLSEAQHYYQKFCDKAADLPIFGALYQGPGVFYQTLVSYIPSFISQYFQSEDILSTVLKTVQLKDDSWSIDPACALVYLSFQDLILQANITGSLKEKFFLAWAQDVQKNSNLNLNYTDYESFEALAAPRNPGLLTSMQTFADNKLALLSMVHELNKLEAEITTRLNQNLSVNAMLQELHEALQWGSENNSVLSFQAAYVQPAVARVLKAYPLHVCGSLLEQVIDNPHHTLPVQNAYLNNLPDIYSRLKSGAFLTDDQWRQLTQCFKDVEQFPAQEMQECRRLQKHLNKKEPLVEELYATFQTPHQLRMSIILDSFILIEEWLTLILNRLDTTLNDVDKMRLLAADDSLLARLCLNKVVYIEKIKGALNQIIADIHTKPNELAAQIDYLGRGDAMKDAMDSLKQTSAFSCLNQLLQCAWSVLPLDSERKENTFLNALLTYYIKDTALGQLYLAEEDFRQGLQDNPIPELNTLFQHPLQSSQAFPESMLDAWLGIGHETIEAWGLAFVKKTALNIFEYLPENWVMSIFPHPCVGRIAFQLLQSHEFKNLAAQVLQPIISQYVGMADKASEMAQAVKRRLYPLLGFAISATLEEKALTYIQNKEAANDAEKDAFAYYYLQYRALKQQNPAIRAKKAAKFLFKELRIQQAFTEAFSALDEDMQFPAYDDDADWLSNTRSQCLFLLQHADFSAPSQETFIRMTLLNRQLLMGLELAQSGALSDENKRMMESLSLKVFKDIRKKMLESPERPNAAVKSMRSSGALMTQIEVSHMRQKLASFQTKIADAVSEREAMLDAHKHEPQLGKPVFEVALAAAKRNKPRTVWSVLVALFMAAGFISTWASALSPLLLHGAFSQSLFVFLGVSSVAGLTATGGGILVFAAVALIRLVVKLGQEIFHRRKEFKEAVNPEHSLLGKIMRLTAVTLKCGVLAFGKMVFTDYIMYQVAHYFSVGPIKRFREMFRFYPSVDVVKEEKSALQMLNEKLTEFSIFFQQKAILPGLLEDRAAIYAQFMELDESLQATLVQLKNSLTSNDKRQTEGYPALLREYELEFIQIRKKIDSLKIVLDIASLTSDDAFVPSAPAPMPAPQQVPDKKPGLLPELAAYLATIKPEASEGQGYMANLLSGFFNVVAYAGSFFHPKAELPEGADFESNVDTLLNSFVLVEHQNIGVSAIYASFFFLGDNSSRIQASNQTEADIGRFMTSLSGTKKVRSEKFATFCGSPHPFFAAKANAESPEELHQSFSF